MGYTLGQVNGYLSAIAGIERERMLSAAVANRAGMAEEKGWKAWLTKITAP